MKAIDWQTNRLVPGGAAGSQQMAGAVDTQS
jgi:hypothetical protein